MKILMLPLFLGGLRGTEWVVIAIVALLLFGAKRIPDLMRNVGKGIRGFKEGMNDVRAEINRPVDTNRSAGSNDTPRAADTTDTQSDK